MADKRITDFATVEEAQDDDLLLISSDDETYNIKVKALKDAVKDNTDMAEAAAEAAQAAAQVAAQVAAAQAAQNIFDAIEQANTIDADVKKVGSDAVITITKKDGTTVTATVSDGEGIQGSAGYTPQKGVDYWTDDDQQAIRQDYIEYISEELAIRSQLSSPDFANDVDELNASLDGLTGDDLKQAQAKLYVLPDGYIYAYMYQEGTVPGKALYTNKADCEESSGWLSDSRLTSTGCEDSSGSVVTNYIECKVNDVLRIKNLNIGSLYNGNNARVQFLNSAKSVVDNTLFPLSSTSGFTHTDNDIWEYTVSDGLNDAANIAYVRFCGTLEGEAKDVIITVNEEIKESESTVVKEYKWTNTGHTFIPTDTDYETRVTEAEKSIEKLSSRVNTLENAEDTGAVPPDYWISALDDISDTIMEKQDNAGVDAFQFIWISDVHGASGYKNPSNGAGTSRTKHIGKVAEYTAEKFNIPFVAISGDLMSQASYSDVSNVYQEYSDLQNILSQIDADKLLVVKGNHDGAWGGEGYYYQKNIGSKKIFNELYRQQTLDRQRVFGDDGTYFYVDSPQKVRIIMLNSQTDGDGSETDGGLAVYNSMSYSVYGTEQLKWLADVALDMPTSWQAVIMSHAPLTLSKDGELLADVISTYNNRDTLNKEVSYDWGNIAADSQYSVSTVNADFSGAKGKIIAFLHGHIHKDTIDTTSYDIPCVSITTAGGDVRDDNPVERVVGAATETAMDIVTVDKENGKIYLTRLGAGSDREVNY